MNLEWFLPAGLLLCCAAALVRERAERRLALALLAAMTSWAALGSAVWTQRKIENAASEARLRAQNPIPGRPGGFVSSDNCRSCHPAEHATWHATFHRTMTQEARPETVLGDFGDRVLEWKGKRYELFRRGAEYWVRLDDPDAPEGSSPARVERRVGLMTGSHHMQAYWVPSAKGNLQVIFPFAWLKEDARWVPFESTFLRDPAFGSYRQHWNNNCMNCHATAGQARPNPVERVFETRTAELGIACEACHGRGEVHVRANQDPLRRYRLRPAERTDSTIVNPARLDAKLGSQVCGQCHGIHWIPDAQSHVMEGLAYRPGEDLEAHKRVVLPRKIEEQNFLQAALKGDRRFVRDRFWGDGMVRVSGREHNGLVESPCAQRGQLSCFSCHSMHGGISSDDQLAPGMDGDKACLQCHQSMAGQVEKHTHHRQDSAGSRCYNCHMPHTTYGLLKAIRSHQISSPSAAESVRYGRPNACNLCHLDKTLAWTGEQLTSWYGQESVTVPPEDRRTAASVVWLLNGDAGQRALAAWHLGWSSAIEASGRDWQAPLLARALEDPYSAVRFIAYRSLKQLDERYRGVNFDFVGSELARSAAVTEVLRLWEQSGGRPSGARLALPYDASGRVETARVEELVRTRNNLSVDLQE